MTHAKGHAALKIVQIHRPCQRSRKRYAIAEKISAALVPFLPMQCFEIQTPADNTTGDDDINKLATMLLLMNQQAANTNAVDPITEPMYPNIGDYGQFLGGLDNNQMGPNGEWPRLHEGIPAESAYPRHNVSTDSSNVWSEITELLASLPKRAKHLHAAAAVNQWSGFHLRQLWHVLSQFAVQSENALIPKNIARKYCQIVYRLAGSRVSLSPELIDLLLSPFDGSGGQARMAGASLAAEQESKSIIAELTSHCQNAGIGGWFNPTDEVTRMAALLRVPNPMNLDTKTAANPTTLRNASGPSETGATSHMGFENNVQRVVEQMEDAVKAHQQAGWNGKRKGALSAIAGGKHALNALRSPAVRYILEGSESETLRAWALHQLLRSLVETLAKSSTTLRTHFEKAGIPAPLLRYIQGVFLKAWNGALQSNPTSLHSLRILCPDSVLGGGEGDFDMAPSLDNKFLNLGTGSALNSGWLRAVIQAAILCRYNGEPEIPLETIQHQDWLHTVGDLGFDRVLSSALQMIKNGRQGCPYFLDKRSEIIVRSSAVECDFESDFILDKSQVSYEFPMEKETDGADGNLFHA